MGVLFNTMEKLSNPFTSRMRKGALCFFFLTLCSTKYTFWRLHKFSKYIRHHQHRHICCVDDALDKKVLLSVFCKGVYLLPLLQSRQSIQRQNCNAEFQHLVSDLKKDLPLHRDLFTSRIGLEESASGRHICEKYRSSLRPSHQRFRKVHICCNKSVI